MGAGRRDLLRIGVVVVGAGLIMARPWQGLRGPDLVFEDMTGLAPLRRLATRGAASGGDPAQAVFAGLAGAPRPEARILAEEAAMARLRDDPCAAFGLDWTPGGAVPVTYFTDIRCPSCRVLEGSLAALSRDGDVAMRVVTREFPVFGPRSEAAARAIVAAGMQGEAEAMRAKLLSRPAPEGPTAAVRLAAELDIDPAAFVRDLASEAVTRRLAEDRALARLIGLPGTPGLVVGRTVVVGAQPREVLRALIQGEAEDGAPAACRG
jgi:predicted DsbA family dithiol-disulfide isomerase